MDRADGRRGHVHYWRVCSTLPRLDSRGVHVYRVCEVSGIWAGSASAGVPRQGWAGLLVRGRASQRRSAGDPDICLRLLPGPANDDFARATPLTGFPASAAYTGPIAGGAGPSTGGASLEPGEPGHRGERVGLVQLDCPSGSAGMAAGLRRFCPAPGFGPLAVYTGNRVDALSYVGTSRPRDGKCGRLRARPCCINAVEGEVYRIAVTSPTIVPTAGRKSARGRGWRPAISCLHRVSGARRHRQAAAQGLRATARAASQGGRRDRGERLPGRRRAWIVALPGSRQGHRRVRHRPRGSRRHRRRTAPGPASRPRTALPDMSAAVPATTRWWAPPGPTARLMAGVGGGPVGGPGADTPPRARGRRPDFGGPGPDRIEPGAGSDSIDGGPGDDRVEPSTGHRPHPLPSRARPRPRRRNRSPGARNASAGIWAVPPGRWRPGLSSITTVAMTVTISRSGSCAQSTRNEAAARKSQRPYGAAATITRRLRLLPAVPAL